MSKLNRRGTKASSGGEEIYALYVGPGKDGTTKIKISRAKVIKAIEQSGGLISIAAKNLHITYSALKKYIDKNPKVKKLVELVEEVVLDNVESQLLKNAKSGNVTAQIFYLKTKGKKRGYIEDEKYDLSKLTKPISFIYNIVPGKVKSE